MPLFSPGGGGSVAGEVSGSNATTITVFERLDRYVDYVNGSDANDGATPYRAKKTIQAAYNALQAVAVANYTADSNGRLGVGRLVLMPGQHDVGAGLSFDARYGVEIVGSRSGHRNHDMHNSASIIMSSSATATELCLVAHTGTIGMGFVFRDVGFVFDTAVNTLLTKILYLKSIDHMLIENCSFDTADNTTVSSATAIYHEDLGSSLGDDAWGRIEFCNSANMQFYKCTSGNGQGNFNRMIIRGNVCFYGSAPSKAIMEFAATFNGLTVEDNNLEGAATKILVSATGSTVSVFKNNSGEDTSAGTPANPAYDITGTFGDIIIVGGSFATPNATGAGIFARFGASANGGIVIGQHDKTGSTALLRKIVDNSVYGVRILDRSAGMYLKYKSGSGATISDSDYAKTPDDGAVAIAHDTGTGQDKFYFRVNGAWRFVDYNLLLTTKGDLLAFGSAAQRVAVGTDGQVLTADSASTPGMKWAAATGGPPTGTAGGDLAGTFPNPTLKSGLKAASKGDLLTFSTVPAVLAVGANAKVLTADSTQTDGVAWEAQVVAKGGTVVNASGVSAQNIVVWRAPYACTVTALKGWRTGGTGATVNAGKGTIGTPTSTVLASDLSLTVADAWTDGGAVQNTAFAAGDPLILVIASVAGSPTEIAIQVEFTNP